MARPECGDQAHDSADEEQPPQEDRDGDGGNGWNNDRQQAEDDEDDTLGQEQTPMLANRLCQRALQFAGAARVR
jgi:hypothetical protein